MTNPATPTPKATSPYLNKPLRELSDVFRAGEEVICGCECHKGQHGVVKRVSDDGSLVSISLSHDDIAIPTERVKRAKSGDAP